LNDALKATHDKKFDEAIRLYQKVIDQNPNHLPALQGLGLNHFSLGHYRKSRRYLEKAYSLDRHDLTTLILFLTFDAFAALFSVFA